MRFITTTFVAVLATVGVQSIEAQSLYTCGDGTVRSVQAITEMVAGAPVISTPDRWGEPQQLVEFPPLAPRPAYVVSVRLFDVIYTAEAFADAFENLDPTRLTENEPISICVNRDRMILDGGDGTDFRANIVRIERLRRVKDTQ